MGSGWPGNCHLKTSGVKKAGEEPRGLEGEWGVYGGKFVCQGSDRHGGKPEFIIVSFPRFSGAARFIPDGIRHCQPLRG